MKRWLVDRFLPMWAKETVLADNRRLMAENRKLRQENREQQAYIQGLEAGIRAGRNVRIYSRGGEA